MSLWKWNVSLTELWSETSSAPKSHTFGTSLLYNGGNVLMQSSSKAWLHGPMRQNTEREGLIKIRESFCSMINYTLLGENECNKRPFTAHSGLNPWSGTVFPSVICTYAGNPSAKNMVSSAFTDICFWPGVAHFAHPTMTD